MPVFRKIPQETLWHFSSPHVRFGTLPREARARKGSRGRPRSPTTRRKEGAAGQPPSGRRRRRRRVPSASKKRRSQRRPGSVWPSGARETRPSRPRTATTRGARQKLKGAPPTGRTSRPAEARSASGPRRSAATFANNSAAVSPCPCAQGKAFHRRFVVVVVGGGGEVLCLLERRKKRRGRRRPSALSGTTGGRWCGTPRPSRCRAASKSVESQRARPFLADQDPTTRLLLFVLVPLLDQQRRAAATPTTTTTTTTAKELASPKRSASRSPTAPAAGRCHAPAPRRAKPSTSPPAPPVQAPRRSCGQQQQQHPPGPPCRCC
mmetsp:Transcript_82971/g.165971  ORF Transcript_82971/g.165971 Transcript_82971/m.165971 type:complete len:321 (+) Transcript_82971:617-1579(+)